MPERWVVNASPLIVLAQISHERLLHDLAEQAVVPQAVADEIEAGPEDDPARKALAGGLLPIVPTSPPPAEVLAWDLGAGETAVIAHALANPGWTVILDDAMARRCARSYGLPLKGTLALVLLAKKTGLIPSAAEVLRALRQVGFRLDDATLRQALLQGVGEEWP